MTVTIRPPAPSDRVQWERLWEAYLRFYETVLPKEQYDLTWNRLLDPSEPMHCFVAVDETGKIVGLAHAILHRSCWLPDWTCYLQDLYVSMSARGRGTGAALVEAVSELARENRATRLHWLTHESNATARRLYDRMAQNSGFIQYRKTL